MTARCRPDARVVGATPARQASELASGNRARQSPISLSKVAARMVPQRGSDRKMWASVGVKERGDERVELVDLLDQYVEHFEIGDDDSSSSSGIRTGGPFRCPFQV